MARYINLDELLTTIDKNNGRLPSWLDECIMECKCYFDDDVAPVKHGHWVGYETKSYKNSENGIAKKYYRCSSCRYFNAIRSNYCPNCGAKMDGGDLND